MDCTNGKDVTYDQKLKSMQIKYTLVPGLLEIVSIHSITNWSAIGQSERQNGRPGMQWEDMRNHEPHLKSHPSLSFDLVTDFCTHVIYQI